MLTVNITRRPLSDAEIDLLMRDISFYPNPVYVKKSRFQTYKNAYVLVENGQFVGVCGVYTIENNWIKLGPLVFLRNYHGKGYGKLLLNK